MSHPDPCIINYKIIKNKKKIDQTFYLSFLAINVLSKIFGKQTLQEVNVTIVTKSKWISDDKCLGTTSYPKVGKYILSIKLGSVVELIINVMIKYD